MSDNQLEEKEQDLNKEEALLNEECELFQPLRGRWRSKQFDVLIQKKCLDRSENGVRNVSHASLKNVSSC